MDWRVGAWRYTAVTAIAYSAIGLNYGKYIDFLRWLRSWLPPMGAKCQSKPATVGDPRLNIKSRSISPAFHLVSPKYCVRRSRGYLYPTEEFRLQGLRF